MLIEIRPFAEAVAAATGVSVKDMRSPTKLKHIVHARHLAMWLAIRHGATLTQAAHWFGRHHTTGMWARDRMDALLASGDPLAVYLAGLRIETRRTARPSRLAKILRPKATAPPPVDVDDASVAELLWRKSCVEQNERFVKAMRAALAEEARS